MPGYALSFDGTSMMLPQNKITFGATWTVEMWIKPINYSFGGLFGYYPNLITTTDGNGLLSIGISGGGNVNFGSGILKNQVWQHLAITHNNGAVICYRDGTQVGAGSLNLNVGSIQCFLGGRPNHNPPYLPGAYRYKGLMDELRIWNTARTKDEIVKTVHKRLVGNEAGLQSLWTFDEGTGTPTDRTATANHINWIGNGGTWNEPVYVPSEIQFFQEKYLVKDGANYKTFKNGSWLNLGSNVTDSLFLSDGMDTIDEMLSTSNSTTVPFYEGGVLGTGKLFTSLVHQKNANKIEVK